MILHPLDYFNEGAMDLITYDIDIQKLGPLSSNRCADCETTAPPTTDTRSALACSAT